MKNNLKKILKQKKKTPADLAKHLGMSEKDVLLLADDKKQFNMKSFLQTCGYLKTSADKMFDLKTTGLNTKTWDVCLYDSAVILLLENCYRNKIEPMKERVSKWALLTYNATVLCHYDTKQMSMFADALVEISVSRRFPLPANLTGERLLLATGAKTEKQGKKLLEKRITQQA